jgi:2,3-dihydroxyphenylpropionate 1,2-dioxygenase
MQADHGFTQPLALLAGDVARYPVLPSSSTARRIRCRPHRAVALGRAVGRFWPGGRNGC